jgi:hypothetical protein
MEQEGSLPCSQQSATGIYSEPVESTPHPRTVLFKIPFNITTSGGSCHHSMARPEVVDGEESLHIWRIVGNILNNSRGEPTRGIPPAWGEVWG